MKKITKTGLILFTTGMLLFVGVMATTGWNITKFSINASNEDDYVEKNTVIENKNQTIKIQDRGVRIDIQPSSDNQIHITYFESDQRFYLVDDQTDITFKKNTRENNLFGLFSWDFNLYVPTMLIELPVDFAGNLDISTSNATIDVEGITANKTVLNTNNGKVNVKNAKVDSLKIHSSNGIIELSSVESNGIVDASTSNGRVVVESLISSELNVETSNGSVTLENVSVESQSNIHTSNGKIDVRQFETQGDVKMGTSNGSIGMTLIGKPSQFSIKTKTTNGSSNLNNSDEGEQILDLKTSNGSIKVDFID